MITTMKGIKKFLDDEERRLKERMKEETTIEEGISLHGSLMTVRKMKGKVK